MNVAGNLPWIAGALLAANAIVFALYGADKILAVRNLQRIPERTLLVWTALGGSIGAKLAQRYFRHKTRKKPFAQWLNFWLFLHAAISVFVAYWIISR